MKQTPLQRITRILRFYLVRGINKESVNKVYRKIIKTCEYCHQKNNVHKMSCPTQKIVLDAKHYENQFKPKGYENT